MRAELLQETKENFAHIQIYILILAEETTYCTVVKERSKKEDKKKKMKMCQETYLRNGNHTHMLKDRHSYSNQKKVCTNHCEIRRGNKIDFVGKEIFVCLPRKKNLRKPKW